MAVIESNHAQQQLIPPAASELSPPGKKRSPRRFRIDNVLIPVIAALVGALIGAVVSVFVSIYQVDANQKQASIDNLRTQRQAAYQSFLNESTYAATQWLFYTSHDLNGSAQENMYSSFSQLQGDYYQVALAGPGTVALQSYIVWGDLQRMLQYLNIGAKVPENSATRADLVSYYNDTNKLIAEMRQVIQDT
jgi:hypothetical protein